MSDSYPPPNDRQWEAIRATDEHILVSASAGTGKTYTVVTKILYLLGVPIRGETCASPIQLDDIAAITFTNKAAAELRAKLRDALRAVGRRSDAYRVDSARIGTIHNFCANTLREFALRTGRAPSLQLVEEAESVLLRGECVRDALLEALEQHSIPGLEDVVATYTVAKVERVVARLIDQGDQLEALIARAPHHASREHALLSLAAAARDLIVARLGAASQVDFDRMITWTRDLVRDEPTVRRTLQRRIRVLFIDEFQDVDPAQREIAYLLAEPDQGRAVTTRLVLVGDPKQSIYRFRNADVTVWRGVERDFTERGWPQTRIVSLLENRRSVAPILAFVDHTVGKLLDRPIAPEKGLQDFEVTYAPMSAARTDAPAAAVEVVTIPALADGKMRKVEDVRAIEARALADRVRALHDADGMAWSDISVLLCGWGAAETYDETLKAAGVPTYILRDEGFYSRLEVTDVLVALEVIRNPFDDRALFGFLRSPFVGLADESLFRIVQQCASPCWPDLRKVNLVEPEAQQLLARGIAALTQLGAIRDRVSTAELIQTLIEDTGYLAHLELLGSEGKQRIANLRKLVRLARSMADDSVGDFLDIVARQREVEAREGDAPLFGPTEDVVTITSVHCAKGLEWRAVFWCDLVRTSRNVPRHEMLIGRERVLMPEPTSGASTSEFLELWGTLDAEQQAESKRLWYVAATRAKDLLVLSGVPLGTGGRIIGSPAGALREIFGGFDADSVEYESATGARYSAAVRRARIVDDEETLTPVESLPIGGAESLAKPQEAITVPIGRGRHSATELLSMARCERRHWFRYVAGLREPQLRHHSSTEYGNAIRRGLVVHDVLERYIDDIELGVLLEAAIGRWDPDAPPPDVRPGIAYRQRLTQGIETILANSSYRNVLDREDARRELGVSYVRSSGEYVDGKIDLIAPSDDGYAIVDVKTSECDEDVAKVKAEQYAPQKATYVGAVEGISGSAVESFGFQFAGAGAHVGGSVTNDDRKNGERMMDELIQLARAGSREMTRFPGECEFCGYREVGWCPGAAKEVETAAE